MGVHQELLDLARDACLAGAEEIEPYFRAGDLRSHAKGEHDFVTEADRKSEARIVELVLERYPEHRILAEEGSEGSGGESDFEWLIDPLDGTTNFMHGLPVYAVSVACRGPKGLLVGAIYSPPSKDLYLAERRAGATWNGQKLSISSRQELRGAFLATGYPFRARAALDTYLAVFRGVFEQAKAIRRCGSAALDLAHTAAGVYDGFFEFCLSPWDIAAGALLIREAGGTVTDLDGGDRFLRTGNIIAGAPGVQQQLLEQVQGQVSEGQILSLLRGKNVD